MQSTTSLLQKLQNKYPEYNFVSNSFFYWDPLRKCINYDPNDKDQEVLILHELAHALLNHKEYSRDIELIKIEADAWTKTVSLAADYKIKIADDFVDDFINSYKDWLHKRSTCINCKQNGIQKAQSTYKCPTCRKIWKVNNSKFKRLIRIEQ